MKSHKNMKSRKNNNKVYRYTVSLDEHHAELVADMAQSEDRKPAAMIAILAKRKLIELCNA